MFEFDEEYEPKEIITIRMERLWKYRNPEKIVKQIYELPVLVIRNTGKAILVTNEKGNSYANSKNGEAIWIPSYALKSIGDKKYLLKNGVITATNFNKFMGKNKYAPISEKPITEHINFSTFTEFLEESLNKKLSNFIRNKINDAFSSKNFGIYFGKIPFDKIDDILKKYDLMLVQEDGTPWEGIISGESGKTTIDVARISDNVIMKNTSLFLSWYKMDSGKFELIIYLT